MRQDIRELPTIVDTPGEYKARNGKMIIIYAIHKPTGEGLTEFLAKGSIRTQKSSGVGYNYKYNIWHVSGRQFTYKESEHDIVGKW